MTRRALTGGLLLLACHDFQGALGECIDAGICVVGGTSGGSSAGGSATAGGGVSGGSTTAGGGQTAGGTAGGSSTAGGAATAGGMAGGRAGGMATAGGATAGGMGTAGGFATAGGFVTDGGWAIRMLNAPLTAAPGSVAIGYLEVSKPTFNFDSLELFLFTADGGPSGLVHDFTSNDFPFDESELIVTVPFPGDGGPIALSVALYQAGGGAYLAEVPFTVVPRAPAPLLVVDDDSSGANQGGILTSDEDEAWFDALSQRGIAFDRLVMPYTESDGGQTPLALLDAYDQIIWYHGDVWAGWAAFPPDQEAAVNTWLDRGNKRFVIAGSSFLYRFTPSWTSFNNVFANRQLGIAGFDYVDEAGQKTFTGPGFHVPYGYTAFCCEFTLVNPRPATQVLFTQTTPDSGLAVSTRNVTDAGSTVVFLGFYSGEVRAPDAGGKQRDVVRALLDASGIQ